jgi:hypothetical protein
MLGQEFVDDKDDVEDIVGSGKGERDGVVMWS